MKKLAFATRTLLAFALASAATAQVRLPALISNHMVLQQEGPARIWGWAAPGESVTVEFGGQKAATHADLEGHWQLWLNNLPIGSAGTLVVQGTNRIEVQDVLVGEVWIASGQSNMERAVHFSPRLKTINAEAPNDHIRLFLAGHAVASKPAEDVQGKWVAADAKSIQNFAALAYFFGKGLEKQQHVPVGLIESAYGGTLIEAWESSEALAQPGLEFVAKEWQQTLDDMPAKTEKWVTDTAAWKARLPPEDQRKVEAGKLLLGAPPKPRGAGSQAEPSGLYNGMIAPIQKYSVRGILWNQGENNSGTPAQGYRYRKLFLAMIEDWRRGWGEGEIPFLFVQLSRYHSGGYPYIRESQAAALQLANTGMVVSVDVGMAADVHYPDKLTLGQRMLLVANHVAYGKDVEYSGPELKQVTQEPGLLRLWFSHVTGGLQLRTPGVPEFAPLMPDTPDDATADGKAVVNKPPTPDELDRAFRIAGPDGVFYSAKAHVDGKTIVLANPAVPDPVQVCYAWEASTPAVVLWNGAGLPASPFRSGLDRSTEPNCTKP